MTHHTDAARAEFEAWARGYGTWEVKRDDDVALGTTGYTDITLTVAWHAVQAARRAPAVPVPQIAEVQDSLVAISAAIADQDDSAAQSMLRDLLSMLAAAPQPPEAGCSVSNGETQAAPVQLPEYGIDTANHAGIRVRGYTEQQVRELLAAQASVSNGTLASQPPFQTEAGAVRQLEEIAVLAWLLVRALRKADPANPRAARALDYLKRHGLQGNPLRAPGD